MIVCQDNLSAIAKKVTAGHEHLNLCDLDLSVRKEMNSQDQVMASSAALKSAKKELRSLMKQKLISISKESISSQSKLYWSVIAVKLS